MMASEVSERLPDKSVDIYGTFAMGVGAVTALVRVARAAQAPRAACPEHASLRIIRKDQGLTLFNVTKKEYLYGGGPGPGDLLSNTVWYEVPNAHTLHRTRMCTSGNV